MARTERQRGKQAKKILETRRGPKAVEEAEAALAAVHGDRDPGHAFLPKGTYGRAMARAAPFNPEEEEAPFGFGMPHTRSAERRRAERRELSPRSRELVKRAPSLFRLLGDAARAIETPIRQALESLQRMGHEARRA